MDPRLRFDTLVVGSANRLAAAAARAVADAPGSTYNPLVVYGGPGLGKTHLMCAIGNHVRQSRPGADVRYVAMDDLLGELHTAVAEGTVTRLRERMLRTTVLLVDDIQFLSGRAETQAELMRILEGIPAAGGQLVLSSDRSPSEIPDVDERLRSRLVGGLLVDVGSPDYETRLAILRTRCAERGVDLLPGVAEQLAGVAFPSVRELQGALNRLVAAQTLGGARVTPSEVMALLSDVIGGPGGPGPLPGPASAGAGEGARNTATAPSPPVDGWRAQLTREIDARRVRGVRTGALDRLLGDAEPPADLAGALQTFDAQVTRLRELQAEVAPVDPAIAAGELFNDPERLAEAEALVARTVRAARLPGPSRAFTRAGFEVGECNSLAVRAADAVVAAPAERYNPLFIHGPTGVGKTHLAHAIGNTLLASGQARRVACVTAQEFVDELVAALQANAVEAWRGAYRQADALVVDDVQFIAGKERTQEELFHVFNALHRDGRQIVFISDCPPRDLGGLEERLRSRFEGGLVVEMRAPDRALRERLVARQLADYGVTPSPAALARLADRHVGSVRELAGMIHGIVAAADAVGEPLAQAVERMGRDAPLPSHDPGAAASGAAASGAAATSGTHATAQAPVVAPLLPPDKFIVAWPDVASRIVEEPR
jgi:chromosomal replication initiator protein